ncbi:E3 ubiquitin-protein ligase TRIM39-like isoform X2 [Dicentrarchus labrax]|uniref:E3 ubiquitin-protein ligase TRIM39-like isoform X2 n=1 Tax=Dicentrarchus labrax TaxID=13489 RepID=UPI0021F5F08B|nr:E3 ubiquitin-protein ligase TRIM39-like isoform X2 [Dicentrarchus labrax]
MSLVEELSQENEQKEPEIRLQSDDKTNQSDPDCKKDLLMTGQRDKRAISPLSLFKEDFNHFKEDVLKVFKDKDTKTEHEDCPSSQAENKPVSSTLSLLKEDFSQFKEDMTKIFSISLSKDKETKSEHQECPSSQAENIPVNSTLNLLKEDVTSMSLSKDTETKSTEKMIDRLSLLKDFSNFKDDISNVSRTGLSKESDTAKEDSLNTFKIKSLKAERTDEPLKSLFSRDQKTSQKAGDNQGVKKTFAEMREEQLDDRFRGNLSEQKEETVDAEKNNNMKDGMDKLEVSAQKTEPTSFPETVSAIDERINEIEEDEKPLETLPWESLSFGIHLFHLRDPNKEDLGDQPGDDLCNRNATRMWSENRRSDHPERFERCPQVLCREGLLDSVYWEVVWSGGADIGVTYNSISRGGDTASCLLGHNQWSWSLECSEGSYTPCHDNKRFRSSSPRPFTHRVGVYLNWSAGSLSFYCVSQDAMVHLHTFTSTFTEPLYPGFWVWAYEGSVSLCQVALDWERLLQ